MAGQGKAGIKGEVAALSTHGAPVQGLCSSFTGMLRVDPQSPFAPQHPLPAEWGEAVGSPSPISQPCSSSLGAQQPKPCSGQTLTLLAPPWGTWPRATLTLLSVASVASLCSRDRHTVVLEPLIMNNY